MQGMATMMIEPIRQIMSSRRVRKMKCHPAQWIAPNARPIPEATAMIFELSLTESVGDE